jgi:arginase
MNDRGWVTLGVPIDCSGRGRGEERGPTALRAAGLIERVAASDAGDLEAQMHDATRDPGTGIIGFAAVCDASERIRQRVAGLVRSNARLLVVGGCCTLVPGLMAGVRDVVGSVGLAFVDGHLDFYDGATSDTGEMAEMDLAIITGHGPSGLVDIGGDPPIVDPARIVVIGHRDDSVRARLGGADPAEVEPAITLVHGRRLAAEDPAQIGQQAAELLARRAQRFWLHFDLDVLDKEVMPAVTYPQPNGPSWNDVAELLAPLVASPALLGVNVTDFNPDRDSNGTCARLVVDLLARVIASRDS